jgi:hypothetical protein
MICFASFLKNLYISVFSVIKPKKRSRRCFYIFVGKLNDDFCMNSHNVDSDEAMKQGNER